MPTWSTSCPDWKERIRSRRTLIRFDPLFPASAEAKMAVFKALRIADLGINPATDETWTIGESADAWLLDFAAAFFGAYNAETGEQLIREGMLLVSKKNTKSTIAAGIMLTELITGWRPSDELLILAPTIEVAGNSFKPACDMIRADEELSDLLHIQEHIRLITNRDTKATLKVVAADAATVSGKKASRVLVDELWLFGKRPNADAMFREATGGQVSRPEGYTLYLTTQSDEPPAGVFKEKLAYARDIRDGKATNNEFLPVLYEFPEEMLAADEHLDPANFYITNPNLGRSVSQKWLEAQFSQITNAEDGTKQVFFAKHLNVEIGVGLRHDAWVGATYWAQAKAAVELWDGSLEQFLQLVEVAVSGIDGGGLDDLFGLALLGRLRADPRTWLMWNRAWAHVDVFERRKDIVSRLRDFMAEGTLIRCEDPTQDLVEVADLLEQVKDAGLFPDEAAIGLDPQGVAALVDELSGRGFTAEQMVAVPQGFRLTGAIKGSERKLKDGTLIHAGQKLMNWCVGNAKVEPRGSAILITKQVSGTAKIDPLLAGFNAVVLMTRNPRTNTFEYTGI
ncbi:terminase large subunit [Sphingomonas mucosissima]|uniref:Phage terminase n=1 Tax=Sphingomonas mucosissima TaxID=370959 RepID=A0A245ZRC2_9SPHN|nr:terminase large subunit [Sphingomonas mucosissima]OWK32287.1 phage terminase [Sphingomonas mucosissima]